MNMTAVFVFTAPDPLGNESIIGFAHPQAPNVMVPIVARTKEELEGYRPFAEKLAEALQCQVSFVKFTGREVIETIS